MNESDQPTAGWRMDRVYRLLTESVLGPDGFGGPVRHEAAINDHVLRASGGDMGEVSLSVRMPENDTRRVIGFEAVSDATWAPLYRGTEESDLEWVVELAERAVWQDTLEGRSSVPAGGTVAMTEAIMRDLAREGIGNQRVEIAGASFGLTPQEVHVTDLVGQAATMFATLPQMHPSDMQDVVFHVHAIQSIVMARAAMRAHPQEFPMHGDGRPYNDKTHVVVMQPAEGNGGESQG
jgi:hypothetical protein